MRNSGVEQVQTTQWLKHRQLPTLCLPRAPTVVATLHLPQLKLFDDFHILFCFPQSFPKMAAIDRESTPTSTVSDVRGSPRWVLAQYFCLMLQSFLIIIILFNSQQISFCSSRLSQHLWALLGGWLTLYIHFHSCACKKDRETQRFLSHLYIINTPLTKSQTVMLKIC